MKIAVDYQSTQGAKTGIGVSAKNLIDAMKVLEPGWEWILYTRSSEADLNTVGRIYWESVEIPKRAKKDRPNWIYSPGFSPAFASSIPQIVTVHDLIGMIYPQNLPLGARFYWSMWLPSQVKKAKVIVASSESTLKDLSRLIHVNTTKVRVVPLASHGAFYRLDQADSSDFPSQYGLNRPYFLTVGTIEPRKNIPQLLKAYKIYKKKYNGTYQLALVGKGGGQESLVVSMIRDLELSEDVKLLGYVADADLNVLYNQSAGYAIASVYEGFGLPVLEAMTCGVSGLCSSVSSLPEIAGDAALYMDPQNIEDMAIKMHEYASDTKLRESLSDAAYRRSKEFTWEKTAKSMLEVIREAS